MDHAVSFAHVLKHYRKACDLTQHELARRVGYAPVTIQRLEQSTLRPSRHLVQRLADVFELSGSERDAFARLARGRALPAAGMLNPPDGLAAAGLPRLPVPLTPLIGRADDIAAVCRILHGSGTRLLTLTGPGGTGKTRLALAVAAELQSAYADGVVFVDLSAIHDPDLLGPTLAHVLGIVVGSSHAVLARLADELRRKQFLLVLDNVEQIVDAAAFLAEFLAATDHLKVLVTSRRALHVYGGHEYAVHPLALPDLQQPIPLVTLAQTEAVALFVARAQAVRPDFCLTEGNATVVADICHRLDGLPLAIELAAARSKLLPPRVLHARLTEWIFGRLQVLREGPRTLPARQQTLRDAIGWSYSLLAAREQQLFQQLAVFVGGCTLEMVEAVCLPGGHPGDVMDDLQALIDQSLVRWGETSDGGSRLSMLETIQAYALEHLRASADADAVFRRHAEVCLALTETVEVQLHGAEQAIWLEHLEQEHDNLRAALAWSLTAAGSVEIGLRLAGAVWWFWDVRGYWREGRAWLERLLAQCEQTFVSEALRAKALHGLGTLVAATDLAEARAIFEERLRLLRDLGDRAGVASALNSLAGLARDHGDYGRADTLSQESLGLYRELDDTLGMADALNTLGRVAQEQAAYDRAARCYGEALILRRQAGSKEAVASTLLNLGELRRSQGDYAEAKPLYEAALTLFRELDDQRGIAGALHNLGEVARWHGNVVSATACLRESLTIFHTLGETETIAASLSGLAGVVAAQGQPQRALVLLGAVEAALDGAGGQLDAADRAVYEQTVKAARAHLELPAFKMLWAEGRAMLLDQAVAYARELTLPHHTASLDTRPDHPTAAPGSAVLLNCDAAAEARPGTPEALTGRETEVLHLVAQGLTNAQIAATLVISPRTVERHLSAIYRKLEVSSRTAAARYATDRV